MVLWDLTNCEASGEKRPPFSGYKRVTPDMKYFYYVKMETSCASETSAFTHKIKWSHDTEYHAI